MKIVILDGYTLNPGDLSWAGFSNLGELIVYDRSPLNDPGEIIKRIGNAEVIYTNKTPLSKEIINACPNIKFIGVLATGYDIIDIAFAKEKGIPVANIPSYGTDAVGQFAIGLLLEICHHIGYHDHVVHEGKWSAQPDFCFWDYPLIELAGKIMGIIGFGRIGRTTGKIAKALGMKVVAFDNHLDTWSNEIAEYVSLDELFKKSDVISLHCPLSPENQRMINKTNIKKMKDGVIILNNSRGQLVNEADLAEALNTGKVYAAGLDVVSSEPIKPDNPLLKAKNCIITPHISWAPKESRQRLMNYAVQNLENFLIGNPINIVNP